MDETQEYRIRGKLNYFLEKGVKIHVKKLDGFFMNGYVVDKETEGVFIFEDDRDGKCHLFALDVDFIKEYRERKE